MGHHQPTYAAIPKLWELQERDVVITDDILGAGGFGQVVRGLWLQQVPVAVKIAAFTDSYDQMDFDNESEIWYSLTHPRILPLFGLIRKGSEWRFVSPIMENGDAKAFLANIPPGPDRQAKALVLVSVHLRDIAEGMAFLHQKDVIHADLKPGQVLVNKYLRGVLTDFGVSKLEAGVLYFK
ncbi:Leucine-rich repeat serine/threonine-protein kinase 2 [Gonapodya sp. JEL0774]|nr:Leucine-rich repeat serine/threonine-protein kinase 2 [Gonapodya sp. JEL0774]